MEIPRSTAIHKHSHALSNSQRTRHSGGDWPLVSSQGHQGESVSNEGWRGRVPLVGGVPGGMSILRKVPHHGCASVS